MSRASDALIERVASITPLSTSNDGAADAEIVVVGEYICDCVRVIDLDVLGLRERVELGVSVWLLLLLWLTVPVFDGVTGRLPELD